MGNSRTATGVLSVLAACAAVIGAERVLRDLGATRAERLASLPGDEIVPGASAQATNAITIAAPPESVWPWLVQMGCGRAGWYSHDLLDNGGRPSARRIDADLQRLEAGDLVPSHPSGRWAFRVERVAPNEALVFGSAVEVASGRPVELPGIRGPSTWAFALRGRPVGGTRLIVRNRGRVGRQPWYEAPIRLVWALGHVLMQQKQLRGIRERAEAAAEG